MLKRLIIVVAVSAMVFGAVFGWKYLQGRQQSGAAGGPPPAVVSTRPVERESWQPSLLATGSITPTRGVVVSAEIEGVIREIFFDSGQAVPQNELLVQLDTEVDLAELAALQADRRLAEITRDRLQRIVGEEFVSQSDLDEAQATLDRAQAQLDAKEATIRKKSIRAPFAGARGIRRINPGQYLGSGDDIVELIALDPIYAEYALPERFLSQLAIQQAVSVEVQTYPGEVFEGRVHAISPVVQRASRSIVVRALISNPDGKLRPGMFAEVRTFLPTRDDVLTIPERAVTYNPYGESVFVVDQSDGMQIVRLVQIETGEVRGGRAEVLRGLEAGDTVVSDGHNKLFNGQPITVDNSVDPDFANPRR